MKAGDCIAWSGMLPHPFFSSLIKIFTGKVTHISMVLDEHIIVEAMSKGLVLNPISERVANSSRFGTVWHLPLTVPLDKKEKELLLGYYYQRLGTEYDLRQAIRSRLNSDRRRYNQSDDKKLFCSEAYVFGLQAAGVVHKRHNASAFTPTDVVQMGIFKEVRVLKGWRRLTL